MSTLNRPPWPHSAVEIIAQINRGILERLNSDPQPRYLWTVEPNQYHLSAPGAMRVIWSILGGPIERGAQYHGQGQPGRCVGARRCRLQAEIRTIQPETVGITPEAQLLAEEVVRSLVIVWNKQRPADYDQDLQEEDWGPFTGDPSQREIVCRYRVTPLLLVHGDPYLFKTIETTALAAGLQVP
jgi:hypothetical protein